LGRKPEILGTRDSGRFFHVQEQQITSKLAAASVKELLLPDPEEGLAINALTTCRIGRVERQPLRAALPEPAIKTAYLIGAFAILH
jgi:hypothetical protein